MLINIATDNKFIMKDLIKRWEQDINKSVKVNMQEGRDSWWSEFFARATTECKIATIDESAVALLQPVRYALYFKVAS